MAVLGHVDAIIFEGGIGEHNPDVVNRCVEGLEEAAQESRNLYKAKQEEIVSKAPVKMMIPTGTLIFPAMLILVLGPILLELGSGF